MEGEEEEKDEEATTAAKLLLKATVRVWRPSIEAQTVAQSFLGLLRAHAKAVSQQVGWMSTKQQNV